MTTAKKPAAKKVVAKKAVARKPAPKKERKLGAVVMSVVEAKPVRRRRRATVVAPVVATPAAPAAPSAPAKAARPLVAKVRARRKVVLPFRERLEEAMHRELKHVGPICHPCRMNASRLAALATG